MTVSFRCRRWFRLAVVGLSALLAGCSAASRHTNTESEAVPHLVTGDIQAGIEQHIDEQTRRGGGYFKIPYKEGELQLKLVRVHTEYLATLGPQRHFACVDLVNIDGNIFDVDFFLEGDPGSMTVTETIVHKLNGQPFYLWEQGPDGTWSRGPVSNKSPALLGVVQGRDSFEFVYQATLPSLRDSARMWIPLPSSDAFQTIEIKSIQTPGLSETLTDRRYGNKVLFLKLAKEDSGKSLVLRYQVERREKAAYVDQASRPQDFLAPERLVPDSPQFHEIASKVLAGKKDDLVRARALYDHTIERMRYMKYGPGWGQGDATYACDARTGNCSDFHSYFIALARVSGIPARFAIGASIPSERNDGGIDGYHCWAEFYADGKWWPVDISEADKYSMLSPYYFGRQPANRIELSRGRDLIVEPGPASGPLSFLAYPLLEVANKTVTVKPLFSFRRTAQVRRTRTEQVRPNLCTRNLRHAPGIATHRPPRCVLCYRMPHEPVTPAPCSKT